VIFAQSGCTSTATLGFGQVTSKRDRLLSGQVCPFPGSRLGARLGFMTAQRRPDLTNHHPAVVEDLTKHAEQTQLRIADAITKYAGSMLSSTYTSPCSPSGCWYWRGARGRR
jgi:hypothetical protein